MKFKSLIAFATLSVVFSQVALASFIDLPESHPYHKAITKLNTQGCLGGYADKTVQPDKKITRAATVKLLLTCLDIPKIYSEETFTLPKGAEVVVNGETITLPKEDQITFKIPFDASKYGKLSFSDIEENAWYIDTLKEAVIRKLITGYTDNTIKPNKTVTKAELYTLLFRLVPKDLQQVSPVPLAKDIKENDWYYDGLQFALTQKINNTDSEGDINPLRELNRGHVAQFISDYIDWYKEKTKPVALPTPAIQPQINTTTTPTAPAPTQATNNPFDPASLSATNDNNTAKFGDASFYADIFEGRITASGEVFSQNKLTAAHKTLPFGAVVRVTNRENNKDITVTINDRGPFTEGRIIDLSKTAFLSIADLNKGVVNVNMEVISLP